MRGKGGITLQATYRKGKGGIALQATYRRDKGNTLQADSFLNVRYPPDFFPSLESKLLHIFV